MQHPLVTRSRHLSAYGHNYYYYYFLWLGCNCWKHAPGWHWPSALLFIKLSMTAAGTLISGLTPSSTSWEAGWLLLLMCWWVWLAPNKAGWEAWLKLPQVCWCGALRAGVILEDQWSKPDCWLWGGNSHFVGIPLPTKFAHHVWQDVSHSGGIPAGAGGLDESGLQRDDRAGQAVLARLETLRTGSYKHQVS